MEETITAAEANRSFSRVLREVRAGRRYIVTSHGTPVAMIVPATSDSDRSAAKAVLLERLARQPIINVPPWTRDELYDDDQ